MQNITSFSKTEFTWRIFFLFMILAFLESMYAYFFWTIPFVIPGIVSVFSLFFLITHSKYFAFKIKNIIPFFLFFATLIYINREQNLNGYIAALAPFLIVFVFFCLRETYKAKFLNSLTRFLSIILTISLFAWILVQLGFNLPQTIVSYKSGNDVYTLTSYYAFVEYTFSWIRFQRFMSIFIEPGYLAAFLAILIYVNNFQLKRFDIMILFIALILTFSIAGYLMLTVAYISFSLKNKKYAIRYLLFSFLLIIAAYNLGTSVNNGNNIFNELVLQRLQVNDGKLSGYNRTNEDMDEIFLKFLDSDSILTGVGNKSELYGNVGFKPYITINGIIGLVLLVFSYLSGWIFNKRLFAFTISTLYIMIFLKGHSEIFWTGYLMIYSTAIYLPDNWREIYIIKNK